MSDSNPTTLESLISILRSSGASESAIQTLELQLNSKHRCAICGRSSGTAHVVFKVAGEVTYSSPTRWVYCYRERDKPLGLCDQCFRFGRFDGFTPDEIAYFREKFDQTDEPDEVA